MPKAARADRPHLAAMCDVARMLAERLGLPINVTEQFPFLTERRDGRGRPARAAGDEIPLSIRIAHVARDAAYQQLLGGVERAADVVGARARHAFDPEIAGALADDAAEILVVDSGESAWEATLAREPAPQLKLAGPAIDRALAAIGDSSDLLSPYLAGRSGGVSRLAGSAAGRCGVDAAGVVAIQRAALIQDVGRVAVGARTWQRRGALSADEWEKVRLHAYQTERVLSRSAFLSALATIAGAHHERLDGSGYHRGSRGDELSLPARLLGAADAYHAMTEPRPHRRARSRDEATRQLAADTSAGLFDPTAATAVIEAAGQPLPRVERPATADIDQQRGVVQRLLRRRAAARR